MVSFTYHSGAITNGSSFHITSFSAIFSFATRPFPLALSKYRTSIFLLNWLTSSLSFIFDAGQIFLGGAEVKPSFCSALTTRQPSKVGGERVLYFFLYAFLIPSSRHEIGEAKLASCQFLPSDFRPWELSEPTLGLPLRERRLEPWWKKVKIELIFTEFRSIWYKHWVKTVAAVSHCNLYSSGRPPTTITTTSCPGIHCRHESLGRL